MARAKRKSEVIEESKPEVKRKRTRKVVVAVPKLNVRDAGSMDAGIVRVVKKGEVFEIMNRAGGWGQIDENEWISLKFTEVKKDE